jgi:hypothetical protein
MAIDLEQLQDSPHLLDILIQMEDVLDSMDIYVFRNWIKGEVVEGPIVRRYWLDMTLRYPYLDMPDPKAGLRLLKHGVRVDFEKGRYEDKPAAKLNSPNASDPLPGSEDEEDENRVWLVRLSIPRRLIDQMNDAQHDFYDEDVDTDDVEDAKDDGMDDEESGFTDDAMGDETDPMSDPMSDPNAPPSGGPR